MAATEADLVTGQLSPESVKMAGDGRIRLATLAVSSAGSTKLTVAMTRGTNFWKLSDCIAKDVQREMGADLDDMVHVIRAWPRLCASVQLDPPPAGASPIPLEAARVAAPIASPPGPVMCIGKNYADHVKEVDTWKTAPGITEPSIPKHPIVFTKAPQSVTSTGSPIRLPPHFLSTQVDYEAELAVVIGKDGKGITEERAMEHVFGYTIVNDVTARDVQKRHQQWFLGKSCDTFCPMGPWILPASEVQGQDLGIQCWVNGELRQSGRTSQLIFSIPNLIATISGVMTLRAGDVIATGTPSGVGSGFNPPKHLKAGDTVLIRVENIGELSNQVE